jgi:hypothetical protein
MKYEWFFFFFFFIFNSYFSLKNYEGSVYCVVFSKKKKERKRKRARARSSPDEVKDSRPTSDS